MTDDLLAYLLDDLCPERRAEIEGRLASEPELRRELDRLQECLASSDDPKAYVDEPPRDLVTRTCCLVERGGAALTPAPAMSTCGAAASVGSRWSLTDYTVCAGVVGVLAMLMMPALRESRDAARRQVCSNNLRALGTAVFDFKERHGPQLPPNHPREPMGMLAIVLIERGGYDPVEMAQSFTCPDSLIAELRFANPASGSIPTRLELATARRHALARLLAATAGTAVQAVYVTDDRRYHNATFENRCGRPLASDAPVVTASGVYLFAHGGQGENVLDESLVVKFNRSPFWKSPLENLFKNSAGQSAAGRDAEDVVLLPGNRAPLPDLEKVVSMRDGD